MQRVSEGPARVLHVLGQMDRGGAETRVLELYRQLDPAQVQFDFLVMREGRHDYTDEIERRGGRVFFIERPRNGGFLPFLLGVSRIVRANHFGIVHAHTGFNAGLVAMAAAAGGARTRVVHSRSAPPAPRGVARRLYSAVMRTLILGFATRLVSCGSEAAVYLFGRRSVDQGNVVIIPNAVEPGRLMPDREAVDEARRSLRLADASVVVGHVGNLRPVKNQAFLIRSFAELLRMQPSARLVIAGGGSDEPQLRQLCADLGISESVEILGPRDDVPTLLAVFDLVVMPSLWEGVPGAAVEAQATGLPCLLATTISREADVGAGLATFLPLEDGESAWADEMLRLASLGRRDPAEIEPLLDQAGYTASAAAKRLISEVYGLESQTDAV